MDVNPDLLARAYAVYEYYMTQAQQIPLNTGFHQPSFATPAAIEGTDLENDTEFADFLKKLEALSDEDGDGSEGGGNYDEQLKELQKLLEQNEDAASNA